MTDRTGAVPCLWLSREELTHFLGEKHSRAIPDADLEWIAGRIGDACMDVFWLRLEELAKEYVRMTAQR